MWIGENWFEEALEAPHDLPTLELPHKNRLSEKAQMIAGGRQRHESYPSATQHRYGEFQRKIQVSRKDERWPVAPSVERDLQEQRFQQERLSRE